MKRLQLIVVGFEGVRWGNNGPKMQLGRQFGYDSFDDYHVHCTPHGVEQMLKARPCADFIIFSRAGEAVVEKVIEQTSSWRERPAIVLFDGAEGLASRFAKADLPVFPGYMLSDAFERRRNARPSLSLVAA